jgi:lipopolysaccharide export system protein LptA
VDTATETPSRLDLDGLRRHPAVLMTFEPKELRRRLQAVEIQAVLADGEITGADAVGPVRLAQLTGDREDRYGTADRAVLRFDDAGAVRSVQMIGAVHLVEGELVASGQRATLDLAAERIQLSGEATVASPRGTVTAPSVVYDQRRQLATAKDGARAVLDNPDDERLGAIVLGGAQGPIRVEADEAILRQGPGEIIFRGQVRAWQEANRLLADRLRADDQRGQISASGNVETVWYPTDPLAEDQRGGAGEPVAPVEIAADLMNYDREDGRLRYQGNVVALQLGRELSCQDLTVFLDPDGAAKRLVCEGSVSLYDPELSRRASGERAVYEPEVGEMRMDGNPVRLEDPKLGVLEGSPLWYRFETGEFRMGAEATGSGDG